MRTIKIKLPFAVETSIEERRKKLNSWAYVMLKNDVINVIEEQHLEQMSYIVVENTRVFPEVPQVSETENEPK